MLTVLVRDLIIHDSSINSSQPTFLFALSCSLSLMSITIFLLALKSQGL